MDNRRHRLAIFLVVAAVTGCNAASTLQSSGRSRFLTKAEMDQISAGTSTAVSNANASAVGPAPQTTALTNTLASSGNPIPASPFVGLITSNYAMSQTTATASNAPFTAADVAAGSEASHAEITMQVYAMSIGRVDLAFGSAIAAACCAPSLAAQTTADGVGGGYSRQLQASPISGVSQQVQSRVDISVVSSTLPILDAGRVTAIGGPTSSQAINQ
jgi:hypothetical protein